MTKKQLAALIAHHEERFLFHTRDASVCWAHSKFDEYERVIALAGHHAAILTALAARQNRAGETK